jgi:ATP-binding cassette, subfamily B, bacterial PglK
MKYFLNIYQGLDFQEKRKFRIVLLFSLVVSILEALGISLIAPFVKVATDFSVLTSDNYFGMLYGYLSYDSAALFVIHFGILLIGFYFFRAGVGVLYQYYVTNFAESKHLSISYRLFNIYMSLSYRKFSELNRSDLLKSILNDTQHFTIMLTSLIILISECFILILIYALMLYVNLEVTMVLTVVTTIIGVIMIVFVSSKIKVAGFKRNVFHRALFEHLNQAISNFKMFKLVGTDKIKALYLHDSEIYKKANLENQVLGQLPRYSFEAIGFSIIVSIIIYMIIILEGDLSSVFSTLSVFLLGLLRVMPSFNRIINSYNQIIFYAPSLYNIQRHVDCEIEDIGSVKLDFEDTIELNNVSFEYLPGESILNNINLIFNKGDRIGFVGESGSGKSTLVDMIIGLANPSSGSIYIDSHELNSSNLASWRHKISFIPQAVYLFDGTVKDNIVFGLEYDSEKLISVMRLACIFDFFEKRDGVDTLVGESGGQLSGGQMQRVAIARALYNGSCVLVLDEATSALDEKTEDEIMNALYTNLPRSLTMFIISHRTNTLRGCNHIYSLSDGSVIEV